MRKYDCIIHIGAPKSGSSALQHFFVSNKASLAEHGYFYPHHKLDENLISGGHTDIYKYLQANDNDSASKHLAELVAQARKKSAILLLSSEGFFGLHTELQKICEPFNCAIVAVYRDPFEASLSAYSQMVKRNYFSKPLHEYLTNLYHNPKPIYAGLILLEWASLFGKENMYVVPYCRATGNDSIVFKVLKILDLDHNIFGAYDTKSVNTSYHPAILELKRRLNLVLSENHHSLAKNIDSVFQQLSEQKFLPPYAMADQLSPNQIKVLSDKFRTSKQRIEKEFEISGAIQNINSTSFSLRRYYQKVQEDMLSVLEHLELHHSALYKNIYKLLASDLGPSSVNSELDALRMMFNIDAVLTEKVHQTWFSDRVIENMLDYSEVDFLREVAKVLYQRGDFTSAARLIDKAKSIRHNGPAIKALEAKILAKLYSV